MRIAVIHCSHQPDLHAAILRAGMTPVEPGASDAWLDFDGYVLAGDDSAAHEALIAATETGKPVLGLGEGAGVLLALGLVPGLENHKVGITLTPPSPFLSTSLQLAPNYQRNAYTRYIKPGLTLTLAPSHVLPSFKMSPVLLQEIEEQGLNVFQTTDAPHQNVAMSNKAGNVMAVLPTLVWDEQADLLLKSMHDTIKKGVFNPVAPLHYYPRR